jgi:type I restriction enzyme M protein
MVPLSEIAANDYNLNIPRYIDASEPEDLHDLTAHLQGGIPDRDINALAPYWQVFPSMRNALFAPVRAGYSKAQIEAGKIKTTLLEYPEFKAFAQRVMTLLMQWQQQMALQELSVGDNPKALIDEISEALLVQYADTALLNNYDVYQILMDYWNDTMQDDVYLLTQDGWLAGKMLRELVAEKGEKLKETPDIVIDKAKFKADLIAPSLIIARYYKTEQKQLDQLQADLDNATQELESYLEENSGEDGLLAEALNDKDKVTKVTITARLKVATDKEEKAALKQAKALFDAEADSKKALKEAQDQLDRAVFKHYATLSEDDIKTLIVNDKWHATLQGRIQAEIERIIQQLANRVKELEERYAEALPTISQSVDALSLKVAAHLKAMGLETI